MPTRLRLSLLTGLLALALPAAALAQHAHGAHEPRAKRAFAQRERFGVKEERTFTDVVDAIFRRPALACQPVQTS